MVIKLLEPEKNLEPITLIRGRESGFWKKKIFNDLEPYDFVSLHDSQSPSQAFHFLVIFDPHRFLYAEPDGID